MQRKPTKLTKRYWRSYGALYGNEWFELRSLKAKKKRRNDEEVEQIKFNIWFDKFLISKGYRWFHCPNGGGRNHIEASKFKRMGVKAGVPDIIIPMARKRYHGLIIELKRIDGKLSDLRPEQKDWLDWFAGQGWLTTVAYGFEDAKNVIITYFEDDPLWEKLD